MSKVKTAPLISVIMPLYNKRQYVLRAINSVQQQTYDNWELVIVDDGSTDGSANEIPQNDSKIRFFQQDNKGPAAARNKGVEIALGKYVTFLDADDYFFASKLEFETDRLRKNKANWMISAGEYLLGSECSVKRVKSIDGENIVNGTTVFESAFDQLSLFGIPVDGLCIRTETMRSIGGFEERMACFEITEFILRCALYEPRVIVHADPLYRVNDVPGSASKNRSNLIISKRQMGESLYSLSRIYPEHTYSLEEMSKNHLFSYVASQILANRGTNARHYLTKDFPFPRNTKWWKMWAGTWFPMRLVRNFYE